MPSNCPAQDPGVLVLFHLITCNLICSFFFIHSFILQRYTELDSTVPCWALVTEK